MRAPASRTRSEYGVRGRCAHPHRGRGCRRGTQPRLSSTLRPGSSVSLRSDKGEGMVHTKRALLSLILVTVSLVAAPIRQATPSVQRVYTLTEIYAGLQRHSNMWVGRTMLVRGKMGEIRATSKQGDIAIIPMNPTSIQNLQRLRLTLPVDIGPGWRIRILLIPTTVDVLNIRTDTDPPIVGPMLWVLQHLSSRQATQRPGRFDLLRTFRLTLLRTHGRLCPSPPDACADAQLEAAR